MGSVVVEVGLGGGVGVGALALFSSIKQWLPDLPEGGVTNQTAVSVT